MVSGEYVQLGYLNRTEYATLQASVSGQWCQRLDSVACFNSRDVLAANNAGAVALASQLPASGPAPAPAPGAVEAPHSGFFATATQLPSLDISTAPLSSVATGGRRLLSSAHAAAAAA